MNNNTFMSLLHRDPTQNYPVIARGKDIYLYDEQDNRYIDGTAGATNVTLGHGRQRIVQAMAEQAETLAYCFSTIFTNRPAIQLAERLSALAPGDLNSAYLVSSGSEAIETSIKLARLYHIQRGSSSKHKIISRWRSYHGATLGALSLTGIVGMRTPFDPWLADFPHIVPCYPYRCKFANCGNTCNLTCASDLERTIVEHGPENIAAFVAEPVVMGNIAAGVPPAEYFQEIRAICDRYDVLFIADEIITGMGRTGTYFAIEHSETIPDIITFAKGVTSGYSPLGGMLFSDRIRTEMIARGAPFPHVFTNVDNPVSARAALEVLDIIEEENILDHVQQLSQYVESRWKEFSEHPLVGDARGTGLLWGLEIVADKGTKEPFPTKANVTSRLSKLLFERGLSLAVQRGAYDFFLGDDVRFHPPLIINREQVDEVISILTESLDRLNTELISEK